MDIHYTIREAKTSDVPELGKLHRQILELEGISALISERQLSDWYQDNSLPNHIILLVDNRIVSHIEIRKKQFQYDKAILTCGQLSAVHTHPDYRGCNYGLNVLHHALKVMKTRGMAFSTVSSGVKHFYQSAGYELYPQYVYPVRLTELTKVLPKTAGKTYSVSAYSNQRDGECLYNLYRQHNPCVPVEGTYSEPYWHDVKSNGHQHRLAFVAQNGSQTVGYLEAWPETYYADNLLAVNLMVEEGHEQCSTDLLLAWTRQIDQDRYSRAVLTFDQGTSRCPVLENCYPVSPCAISNFMVRIIDLRLMIETFLPLWKERLKKAGISWYGSLTIESLGSMVRVDMQGEDIRINQETDTLRDAYLKPLFYEKEKPNLYLSLDQKSLISSFWTPNGWRNIMREKYQFLNLPQKTILETVFSLHR